MIFMAGLESLLNYLATNPLQKGVGAFVVADAAYSLYDGARYKDAMIHQIFRACRLLTGLAYGLFYDAAPLPVFNKAVGIYMMADAIVSFAEEKGGKKIFMHREQRHLRALRFLRGALGAFLLLYPV